MKNIRRIVGTSFAFLGIAIFVYVLSPIIGYEYRSLGTGEYLSPIAENDVYVFSQSENYKDLTKASNWFEGDSPSEFELGKVSYYSLSIPSLEIKRATVAVGGESLDDSLIQYPGTALPGKRGNAVIFGHSILPQFFNPEDYLTIFSTLPTIKKGEEVEVYYDGIEYRYIVEEKFEVEPTDIEILEQNSSGSYLTLVTCVPPGHPLRPKRLIVRARLAAYQGGAT